MKSLIKEWILSTLLDHLRYFISFFNDFSRYAYVFMIADKANVLDVVNIYKVEHEPEKTITIVRPDRGSEYYGRYDDGNQLMGLFADFLHDCGIVHSILCVVLEQNGLTRRIKRLRIC